MKLLDLYSGAGGAAMGYSRAGFEVVGVDIKQQPRYPFEFVQADALEYLASLTFLELAQFSAIHASPPCQAYSVATVGRRNAGSEYSDLLSHTRDALSATGLPWVIENVPGAPMRADYKLCGCMFDLPLLRRERWFETSWHGFALRAPCHHIGPALSVIGHGGGAGNGQRDRIRKYIGKLPGIAESRAAMGIDWMGRDELSQAIPPAYTEYIGGELLNTLQVAA